MATAGEHIDALGGGATGELEDVFAVDAEFYTHPRSLPIKIKKTAYRDRASEIVMMAQNQGIIYLSEEEGGSISLCGLCVGSSVTRAHSSVACAFR
jgi:hypothetical protein